MSEKDKQKEDKYVNISKLILWHIGQYWVENNPAVISVFDVRITPLFSSAFFVVAVLF